MDSEALKAKQKFYKIVRGTMFKDKRIDNFFKHKQTQLLQKCQLRVQDAQYIASKDCSDIDYLNLADNQLRNEGVQKLSQANWSSLLYLNLARNRFSVSGCRSIGKGAWSQLVDLNLDQNPLTDLSIKYIAQGQWNLMSLSLESCKLGVPGILHLVKAHWPRLQKVDLKNNPIQQSGLQALFRINSNYINLLAVCRAFQHIDKCSISVYDIRSLVMSPWNLQVLEYKPKQIIMSLRFRLPTQDSKPWQQMVTLKMPSISLI